MPGLHTLTISCGTKEWPRVVEMVDAFCDVIGASKHDAHSLHLAIEEAVSNVMKHGYGGQALPVKVSLEMVPPDRVRATIADCAPAYDPLARPEVDTSLPLEARPIGGLGVHLVKRLMHVTHYERKDLQNILTLELVLERSVD